MNKKVTLTALVASMMFGATAHAADTRIGVNMTITLCRWCVRILKKERKASVDIANNLAHGKAPGTGINFKMDGKVVRVPYVPVDKDNLSQFVK